MTTEERLAIVRAELFDVLHSSELEDIAAHIRHKLAVLLDIATPSPFDEEPERILRRPLRNFELMDD